MGDDAGELPAAFDKQQMKHLMKLQEEDCAVDDESDSTRTCSGSVRYALALRMTLRSALVRSGFLFLALSTLGLLGVLFRNQWPNVTVEGAAIATWCLFLASLILLYPAAFIINWILSGILILLLRLEGASYLKIRVIHLSRPQLVALLWSILIFISWSTVFDENYLGAENSKLSRPDWVNRLFICYIIFRILMLIRIAVVLVNNVNRRTEQYETNVSRTVQVGHVIAALTKNIRPAVFDSDWRISRHIEPNRDMSEVEAAVKLQRYFRNLLLRKRSQIPKVAPLTVPHSAPDLSGDSVPEYFTAGVSAQKLATFDYVQNNPLLCCLGRKKVKSAAIAARLGEAIFAHYKDPSSDQVLFNSILDEMKTPGLAATAKNLFDPNNTVLLDKDWIVERCVFAYRDRRNVARSLDDLESISRALGSFLYAIAGVIMFLVGTVVFSEGDLANTTVSLGTTVFAFSFAFAATAQQFFTAFVFLFIRNPYDVGDRVLIPEFDDRSMYVTRITLTVTHFKIWNGERVSMPNYMLHGMKISNIMRSGPMTDLTVVSVDATTPMVRLRRLEQIFIEFCQQNPNDYVAADCAMRIAQIHDSNRLDINVVIAQPTHWQQGQHVLRKHRVLEVVKEAMEKLHIVLYEPPRKPQELVNAIPKRVALSSVV